MVAFPGPSRHPVRSLPVLAVLALCATALAALQPAGASGSGPAFATESAFLTTSSAQSPTNWQAFDGNDFALYDVNHDGLQDVVISNDNLHHYVIDPRLGRVTSEMSTTYYGGYGGRDLDAPAVGDVYGDGTAYVAIEDGSAYLSLWKYDSAGSTATHYNMTKQWEAWTNSKLWDPNFASTHPYNANAAPTSEGHPFLATVDGTATATVFSNAEDVSTGVAYTATGTQRWFKDPPADLNAGVAVADLRGDGHREAVFASDYGPTYVYDAPTGSFLWQFDTRCLGGYYQGNGSNCDWSQASSASVTPTVADLFGDGRKEVCWGTRYVDQPSNPGWTSSDHATVQALVDASHARLWCVGPDGKQLWMQQYPWLNPHVDTRPVAFDVNGDGVKDLIWLDWNPIGHKPRNWETTTRGPNLFALDGRNGALLWRTSLSEAWSNKGFALGDVFGDGRQMIVAEEWGPSGDGVSAIDPHTGARAGWVPLHAGYEASRGPVLGDLGGGHLRVIVPMMRSAASAYCASHLPDVGCREGALDILDTGKPFSSLYSNSQPWTLRGDSTPPPPPPPPGGTFDAKFTIHSANEWWQQVTVQPATARAIATVQVRVNGGAWAAMVHQSYGDWTASVHAVAGSKVEFLATDPGGATSQSLPFTWLDGTTTQGSTGSSTSSSSTSSSSTSSSSTSSSSTSSSSTSSSSTPSTAPPPATFAATFTIHSPNEWWEQVTVQPASGHTVAGVQVRVNGGAWAAMVRQSYGDWTASVHAVAGSKVEFLAKDSAGATSQSLPFTWLDGTATKGSV